MKIKVKNEMDKIKLIVTHQELIIINRALESLDTNEINIDEINRELFDKDEFKNKNKLENKYNKIVKKIQTVLAEIVPW